MASVGRLSEVLVTVNDAALELHLLLIELKVTGLGKRWEKGDR